MVKGAENGERGEETKWEMTLVEEKTVAVIK